MRMLRLLTVVGLLALGHSVPIEQDAEQHDLDFVLRNMTALWEEVSNLRQEINQHLHEGHGEDDHDKIKQEVETLHHEHHVHHLHHPHVGHNDHHSDELLRHLEEFHGHVDSHSDGQEIHSHTHGHGHSHDHHHGQPEGDDDSGEDDSHDHGHGHEEDHESHHPEEDEHDTHGLHEHEDEHEYGHEHGHEHGEHAEHDHDHDHDHDHGHKQVGKDGDHWYHALCTLKPNVDMPESQVRGSVVLSQRKDGKGPVYFDIHLSGIDVANTGRIHGFHVHERAITEGSCGSTGGHFNPTQVTHGAPEDDVRHVGDLGNIEVNENGELHGYIIADDEVEFEGANSILGKAIVVHAGVDDLGKGGNAGSLATGNAGGRLACCDIVFQRSSDKPKVDFRFKG